MAGTPAAKRMAIRLIIERQGAPADERTFEAEIVTIGSDAASSLALPDARVAPEQAIIINEGGRLLLINRADGTRLNGEPLAREARRALAEGDAIEFGPFVVRLAPAAPARVGPAAEAARPALAPATREVETPPENRADAAGEASARTRSFAAILDSLRTEEDSFYFEVEADGERRRLPVEAAELMIGWDESGRRVASDPSRVVAPRAVVRKDWSGVVILPLSAGMVTVNGETVEAPRRLRNGDRLTLLPTPHTGANSLPALVFHEPASLVALDSLLPPQPLPPPVAAAPAGREAAALAPRARADVARRAAPDGRRYFGYFTGAEVAVMACGTLLAAVVIFLLLEWLSP